MISLGFSDLFGDVLFNFVKLQHLKGKGIPLGSKEKCEVTGQR